MRELLLYPGWRYFINLTGQELPLQTSMGIVAVLKAFNGANNIEMTMRHRYAVYGPWVLLVVDIAYLPVINCRTIIHSLVIKFSTWCMKQLFFSSTN